MLPGVGEYLLIVLLKGPENILEKEATISNTTIIRRPKLWPTCHVVQPLNLKNRTNGAFYDESMKVGTSTQFDMLDKIRCRQTPLQNTPSYF